MTELEAYKKSMLQALKKMKVALNEFENTMYEYEGVNIDLSKNYPFDYDIFDYNIDGWIETSIRTIESLTEEKFEEISKGY